MHWKFTQRAKSKSLITAMTFSWNDRDSCQGMWAEKCWEMLSFSYMKIHHDRDTQSCDPVMSRLPGLRSVLVWGKGSRLSLIILTGWNYQRLLLILMVCLALSLKFMILWSICTKLKRQSPSLPTSDIARGLAKGGLSAVPENNGRGRTFDETSSPQQSGTF